ncbi:hypothetical protein K1719_013603 [Acacia pycnantha]|nr:hypothetical protein K1719_013603 [Acacia pycnantha]
MAQASLKLVFLLILFLLVSGVAPKVGAQETYELRKCVADGECTQVCDYINCPDLAHKCYGGWCLCCVKP